jgi:hypothetical protein
MNAEQFAEWRNTPLTVAFFAFLNDYRQSRMEMWASGSAVEFQAQEMAKCQLLHTLINLDDDAIGEFYRKQPKEEEETTDER